MLKLTFKFSSSYFLNDEQEVGVAAGKASLFFLLFGSKVEGRKMEAPLAATEEAKATRQHVHLERLKAK